MYPFENLARNLKKISLILPKKDRRIILILMVLTSLFLVVFEAPTNWLELQIVDFKNHFFGKFVYLEPSQEFLILAIDNNTLEKSPHTWPWPNSYWAEIVSAITEKCDPQAIIIDVHFSEKKDPDSDPLEPFAKAIKANGKIGLIGIFTETIFGSGIQLQQFPPLKPLRDSAAFWGLSQQRIDKDGRTRTFLLQDHRLKKKHIAWELQQHLKLPVLNEEKYLSPAKSEILLAMRSPAAGFPRVSLIELINGEKDPAVTKGKTLVIGATAQVLHDFHDTCLGLVTGPDIVATALQTVRHQRMQIYAPSRMLRLVALLLGTLIWLVLLSDLVKKTFLAFVCTILLLPFLLFAGSFFTITYFPIGMTYLSFVAASLSTLSLYRIMVASEISQSLHEAEICGKIQQAFFPDNMLEHPSGIKCSGLCIPYQNAGGDYFDFFPLKNGNIFFILGDVSGHGISASMITTAAKTVVAMHRNSSEFSLAELYKQLNHAIYTLTGKKMMMTASAGLIDISEQKVHLISAGHLPAILRTRENGIEEFAVPGFPLGVVAKYKVVKQLGFDLPDNGFLVIYTDGIIEGLNWKNEQFGFERMNEKILSLPPDSCSKDVIDFLCQDLSSFTEGREYEDDVTFVVVNFNRKLEEAS